MHMPVVNGWDTFKHSRRRPSFCLKLCVIPFRAWGVPRSTAQQCYPLGLCPVLAQPLAEFGALPSGHCLALAPMLTTSFPSPSQAGTSPSVACRSPWKPHAKLLGKLLGSRPSLGRMPSLGPTQRTRLQPSGAVLPPSSHLVGMLLAPTPTCLILPPTSFSLVLVFKAIPPISSVSFLLRDKLPIAHTGAGPVVARAPPADPSAPVGQSFATHFPHPLFFRLELDAGLHFLSGAAALPSSEHPGFRIEIREGLVHDL